MRVSNRVLLLALAVVVATVWPGSFAPRALAHPLDEYVQALYVTAAAAPVIARARRAHRAPRAPVRALPSATVHSLAKGLLPRRRTRRCCSPGAVSLGLVAYLPAHRDLASGLRHNGGLVGALHKCVPVPHRDCLPALFLSAVLGGLHGLTPGHGKVILASYLVGSRGTARHALLLGGSITFTHTASVIAIGPVALAAGQLLVPQVLVPVLELVSRLLVLGLGARLVSCNDWRDVCPFCRPGLSRLALWAGERYLVVHDEHPRSAGHGLVLTREHVIDHANAPTSWMDELEATQKKVRRFLLETSRDSSGTTARGSTALSPPTWSARPAA